MKTLRFIANMYLGMGCDYCSADESEQFDVELDDEYAAKLEAAVEGEEYLTKEEIEELCPEAASIIDSEACSVVHDMCVINGWDEFGEEACSKSLSDLFEEDLESGEFSFTPENAEEMDDDEIYDAQFDAWWDAECEKMDAMTLHEKAEYLEDYYGLDTDSGCIDYDYEYPNPEL